MPVGARRSPEAVAGARRSRLLLSCLIYPLAAPRGVYGQGWAPTAVKCLILTAGIMFIAQLYRFFLFFTAFTSA